MRATPLESEQTQSRGIPVKSSQCQWEQDFTFYVCARHLVATCCCNLWNNPGIWQWRIAQKWHFRHQVCLGFLWWAGRATFGKSLLQMRVASHPTLFCTRGCRDGSVFRSLSKSWKIRIVAYWHIVTRATLHNFAAGHSFLSLYVFFNLGQPWNPDFNYRNRPYNSSNSSRSYSWCTASWRTNFSYQPPWQTLSKS